MKRDTGREGRQTHWQHICDICCSDCSEATVWDENGNANTGTPTEVTG